MGLHIRLLHTTPVLILLLACGKNPTTPATTPSNIPIASPSSGQPKSSQNAPNKIAVDIAKPDSLDFGEKLMKPYFKWTLDSNVVSGKNVISRYALKGITYEEAYKKLGKPLRDAGWKQSGGLGWGTDSRAVLLKSSNGQIYGLHEYAAQFSNDVQFEVTTPVRLLKATTHK